MIEKSQEGIMQMKKTEKKTEKGLGLGRRKGMEKGRKRVEETIEGAFWREKKRCGILRRNKKKID